ncbi:MAG: thioredoxin family protein [Proteobacteria bacterium]|nr:thioredoxin family protein [Pseudomonadota bacterium]
MLGAPHVRFELAPQSASAQPGGVINVAVHQTIEKGWHTYWKNSGDAGQATQVKWTLPTGWSAGDIVWPAPKRLREATLMTYGYEDQVWLTVPIKVPASAKPGTVPLAAHVDVLVCKDICVPESADVKVDLTVASGAPLPDPRFGEAVTKAMAAAPKPAPIQASAALQGGALKLWAVGGALKGADATGAYFYPDASGVIDHPARQAVEHGPEGLTLTLKPAPALAKAGLTGPVSGLLETRAGVYQITAQPGAALPGATGLGAVPAADEAPSAKAKGDIGGLAVAVLFALIGGVILNLMPCVFPVLSMKAAALARQAHAPAEARRDGFAFAAGALTTFLALALILIVSKAAGHAVGWGFQLQSPDVTAFLTLLVLAIALNLSGVFEAGLSLQGVGSELQTKPGVLGPFFTGVLAVVVGAPCTAPFMASALGYALTAGPLEILLVFLALGIGLALPFVALSLSPGLLRRFPKPGPWMETLRHVLAFPMYATAAFMAWVFAQQAGDLALGWLMAATVGLGLCAYLLGRAQREHAHGRQALVSLGVAAVSLMLVGFLAISATIAAAPSTDKAAASATDLPSEPFTPERLAAAREEGRPVFVNFTAAWCVTCKVNERLAFSDPAVAKAFARTRTLYLVGDWTRRDDVIAKALAEQGRTGVPLYLVYTPGADRPRILPQVLTGRMIAKAVGE